MARCYEDWQAPRGDGQLLIWPDPARLLEATRENHAALEAATVEVQGVALNELRRQMRRLLNHPDGQVLVATGHQTELYHPGVWVKNILINQAAQKLEGDCIHLSVDTDAPKHLQIRWPGGAFPLTDDPGLGAAAWTGQLASPTPRHLQNLRQQVEEASRGWDFEPLIPSFFDSMRRVSMQEMDLAPALTNSLHRLDWDLGLRHQALLATRIWESLPYLLFVHHLLARAGQWASDYNGALEDFRTRQGIRRPGHPMPELGVHPDKVEGAFWLDHLEQGRRSRLTVARQKDRWVLHVQDDAFEFDPSADGWSSAQALALFLRRRHLRISPRALTLTMFVRLLMVDLFVHGIGGGRYDQVSDRIITRFFDLAPPVFAVTTATLYFPAAQGRTRVNLSALEHEGHHLRHSVLGDRKQAWVRQIDAAPHRSVERQLLFRQMHEALEEARGGPVLQDWQRRYAQALQRAREDEMLFDRELFYALQPADRLTAMIERYADAFAD